jgi:Amt family ammonium transporter
MIPHHVPFVMLGAGLLWFGWFGFNAGSALGANALAGTAFVTTILAAASALVVWAALEWFKAGKATAVGVATGVVVGLVTITPAAGYVTPMGAIAMGALGAAASFTAIQLLVRIKSLDDSLDVFACHGVGGITGSILTGVFASTIANPDGANGLLYGDASLMWPQLKATLAAALLAAVGTALILYFIKAVMGLRADDDEEQQGLDVSQHAEEAYLR